MTGHDEEILSHERIGCALRRASELRRDGHHPFCDPYFDPCLDLDSERRASRSAALVDVHRKREGKEPVSAGRRASA